MTSPATPPTAAPPRRLQPATAAVVIGLAAVLAGCGSKSEKAEDKRVTDLAKQVAQLSQQVKAQDARIAALGTGDKATPLAASTQSGPDNTVVAQCAPGSFLFRLPRTPGQGGEALCRPLAAPAPASSAS